MKAYKQFMYHFPHPTNSINALTITPEEKEWCNTILGLNRLSPTVHVMESRTIKKMFNEWFPEELI